MKETPWEPFAKGDLGTEYRKNLDLLLKAAHAGESEDVMVRAFRAAGRDAAVIYIDGMADDTKIQRFLLSPLLRMAPPPKDVSFQEHLTRSVLPLGSITQVRSLGEILNRIFSGDAALICDTVPGALIADVKGFVKRALGQPINESVILGPHEGFNESLRDNIVLLRRLMRTPALISEQMTIGDAAPTRLCMLYVNGIARKETVDEVRRRLRGCRVDYLSSAGMLEQLIEDDPACLFPQIAATERPDRAVSFLSEGQVVILLENSSTSLALPIGLVHLYHAPDDTALRWQYGTFLRMLRLAGMLISLLLPALFISLSVFHPEGMSLSLLTSILESQARVPFSLFSSMLIMLFIFSLINEAGVRVPGAMGGSLSIVAGLILGQAAVDADLFSPLIIIVVALSGLGSYAVPAFSLTLSLRIAQFLLAFLSGMAGYLGLVLGLFVLLMRAVGLTSLGNPYLAPVAPKRPANPDTVARPPIWRQRLRGALANPFHMTRVFGPMRAWDQSKEDP